MAAPLQEHIRRAQFVFGYKLISVFPLDGFYDLFGDLLLLIKRFDGPNVVMWTRHCSYRDAMLWPINWLIDPVDGGAAVNAEDESSSY